MPQTRRHFLTSLGAAAVGLASTRRALAELGAPSAKLERIGIQLYTLRGAAAADLAGVLEKLAKIGYKEVEFAGYYNHPASEIRDLLRQNGLTAPSAHIDLDLIENKPAATFADAKTIGLEWITVPSLPRGARETADDWKQLASRFNKAAARVKEAGFRFAFHNHTDVIKPVGELQVVPIDILMKETDPALVSYEMDVYWVVNAHADPVSLLARFPGRFKMLHLKDSAGPPDHKMADVGAGMIDFKKILANARGIEHYFVEHDSPADAIASATASYKYLSALEF
jgi:sugar phosphate isomerase/epimerase